ncbi:hypothetical protein AYI70_g4915 [Smittium culicis]|uniref:Uncharacterized protein n=1 Tax=Smittium culicis TaxID=133412 RepID=A0A1R1XWT9_9FUNG|nr:hypothetical protein AYI70_g4915 [Smittium culicis]
MTALKASNTIKPANSKTSAPTTIDLNPTNRIKSAGESQTGGYRRGFDNRDNNQAARARAESRAAGGRLLSEADDIAAAEADAGVRPLRAAAERGEQLDQVAEQVADNRLQRVHERDGQPAVRPAPEKHPQLQLHRTRRVPAHRRPEPLLRLGTE